MAPLRRLCKRESCAAADFAKLHNFLVVLPCLYPSVAAPFQHAVGHGVHRGRGLGDGGVVGDYDHAVAVLVREASQGVHDVPISIRATRRAYALLPLAAARRLRAFSGTGLLTTHV